MDKNKINSPYPMVEVAGKGVTRIPLDQAYNNVGAALPKHQGYNPQIPSPEKQVVELPVVIRQGK